MHYPAYSKNTAEKLLKELSYIKGKLLYPFGAEGKSFKIAELSVSEYSSYPEALALMHSNPEEYEKKKRFRVLVKAQSADESVTKDLEDVLKELKIKYSF